MKLVGMKKHAVLSLILMATLMTLLASIVTVHATDVLFIKEHHAPSTFKDPTNTYDGYTNGTNILYHLHLNVTVAGAPVAISNLTMTDNLPAGLTYVPGSQTSSSQGGSAPVFTVVGQKLFWNFSSLGSLTNPVLPPDGGSDKYTATAEFHITINNNVPNGSLLVNNAQAEYYETIVGPASDSNPATTDTIYVLILTTITKSPPVGGYDVAPNLLVVLLGFVGPWIIAAAASALAAAIIIKKARGHGKNTEA